MNYYTTCPSPLGTITLQANENGLLGLWFEVQTTQPDDLGQLNAELPVFQQTISELNEYFEGNRTEFSVPITAHGTDFQTQVWKTLTTIPHGETWSYQDLADAIGNPKAVRAVGLANGKNPVSIIVPCHRVIGKSGKLTGYAGGVERKQWLLNLERGKKELF